MILTRFSLKYPFLIICFWGLIIFFGTFSLFTLRVTRFPKGRPIGLSVSTIYPGANKEKVLDKVTKKLEQELKQIKGMENMISSTQKELSEISLYFAEGISPEDAEIATLLAIGQFKNECPLGVNEPIIKNREQADLPIARLAITSFLPPAELYDFVTTSVKPLFERIKGVSVVPILGGRQNQATIYLNLEKMKEREIAATQVVTQLQKIGENAYLGKNTSYLISGEFGSIKDLESVVIHYLANDKVISLKDIADIREELSEPSVHTYLNGEPCIFMEIFERPDELTLDIQKNLAQRIDQLNEQWESRNRSIPPHPSCKITNLQDSASFLKYSFHDFKRSFWISICVSVLLIWVIFKDWRSLVVSSISIPTSLCGTFFALYLSGKTINFISLGGMILAMGLIIDDMIVIRENIFLRREKGLPPFEGTLEAMKEIGPSVIGTSCSVIAGCLALTFMRGNGINAYAKEFAFTLIAAMCFSLLEAFTLGPIVCAYLLRSKKEGSARNIQIAICNFYEKKLKYVKNHFSIIIYSCVALLITGFICFHYVNKYLMPPNVIGNLQLKMQISSKFSLEEAKDEALLFSRQLFEYPDVQQVGFLVKDNNESSFYIQMVKETKRKLTPLSLKKAIEKNAEKLLKKREINNYFVEEGSTESPLQSPEYTLALSSYQQDKLETYSKKLLQSLGKFDGIVNLASSFDDQEQETSFIFDLWQMNRLGVLTDPAAKELDILLNGNFSLNYHPLHKTEALMSEIKIKTSLALASAQELLAYSYIPNINYTMVPLKSIISGLTRYDSHQIMRKNGENLIEITADFNNEILHPNPISYTENLMQETLPLPEEISADWLDKAKDLKDMFGGLFNVCAIAFGFLYIILLIQYQSITIPFVILLPLPLSISGTLIALFLSGHSLNIFSIIGCVLSVGIAAKNGIILVDYINQLLAKGHELSSAVTTASRIRLRPILMTNCAVFLTTLPIVITWDEFGKLEVDMGIAILGGLVTSLMVSLFIIPLIFERSYSFQKQFSQFFFRYINTPEQKEP